MCVCVSVVCGRTRSKRQIRLERRLDGGGQCRKITFEVPSRAQLIPSTKNCRLAAAPTRMLEELRTVIGVLVYSTYAQVMIPKPKPVIIDFLYLKGRNHHGGLYQQEG